MLASLFVVACFGILALALVKWYNSGGLVMDNKGIKLIQKTKYRWEVTSLSGHMIVDNIHFPNAYHAEMWAKAYVSSWNDWTYQLILKEGA